MDPVYHTVIAPSTPTVSSNEFLDYIQQLLPWEQTYLANIKYLPTIDQVIGYFQEGFLLMLQMALQKTIMALTL